jgi:hypothetical protein
METISFLLGVAAVITLVIVVVTFMNYGQLKISAKNHNLQNLMKRLSNVESVDQ